MIVVLIGHPPHAHAYASTAIRTHTLLAHLSCDGVQGGEKSMRHNATLPQESAKYMQFIKTERQVAYK